MGVSAARKAGGWGSGMLAPSVVTSLPIDAPQMVEAGERGAEWQAGAMRQCEVNIYLALPGGEGRHTEANHKLPWATPGQAVSRRLSTTRSCGVNTFQAPPGELGRHQSANFTLPRARPEQAGSRCSSKCVVDRRD